MGGAIPSPSDSPRGRPGEADVGFASRDASVELALGPPCEQADAAGTMPEEGAVTVTAKSEIEPSVSSGTVAESRTSSPNRWTRLLDRPVKATPFRQAPITVREK